MLLLSTSCLEGYSIHKIFDLAEKSGFKYLELDLNVSNFEFWDAEYLKTLIEDFGIGIKSITAPKRNMDEKKVDKIVKIAKEIGAENITFSPPLLLQANAKWFSYYIKELSKKLDIKLSVQNLEPKYILFIIPEHKNNSFEAIKSLTGNSCLDISNLGEGQDLMMSFDILGNSIQNIYLSDKNLEKDHILFGKNAGKTFLPIKDFLKTLKNYENLFTLKFNPKEFKIGEEKEVLEELIKARSFVEEMI